MACCGKEQLKNFLVRITQEDLENFKYNYERENCTFVIDFSPQDEVLKKEILNSFLSLNKSPEESCKIIDFETLVAEHPKFYGFPRILNKEMLKKKILEELGVKGGDFVEIIDKNYEKFVKKLQDKLTEFEQEQETGSRKKTLQAKKTIANAWAEVITEFAEQLKEKIKKLQNEKAKLKQLEDDLLALYLTADSAKVLLKENKKNAQPENLFQHCLKYEAVKKDIKALIKKLQSQKEDTKEEDIKTVKEKIREITEKILSIVRYSWLPVAILNPEQKQVYEKCINEYIKQLIGKAIKEREPGNDGQENTRENPEQMIIQGDENADSIEQSSRKATRETREQVRILGGPNFLREVNAIGNRIGVDDFDKWSTASTILYELYRRALAYLEKPDSYKLKCPLDDKITLDDFLTFRRWFCGEVEYTEGEIKGILTATKGKRNNPPKLICEKEENNGNCAKCKRSEIESTSISKVSFYSPLPFILDNQEYFLRTREGLRGLLTTFELFITREEQATTTILKRKILYEAKNNCEDYKSILKEIKSKIESITDSIEKQKQAGKSSDEIIKNIEQQPNAPENIKELINSINQTLKSIENNLKKLCDGKKRVNREELKELEDELFKLYSEVTGVKGVYIQQNQQNENNCNNHVQLIRFATSRVIRLKATGHITAGALEEIVKELGEELEGLCNQKPNEEIRRKLKELENKLFALCSVVALVEGKGEIKNYLEQCCLERILSEEKSILLGSLRRGNVRTALSLVKNNCFPNISYAYNNPNQDEEDSETTDIWDREKYAGDRHKRENPEEIVMRKENNKVTLIESVAEEAAGFKGIVEETEERINGIKATYPKTVNVLNKRINKLKESLNNLNLENLKNPEELTKIRDDLSEIKSELYALTLIIELIEGVEIIKTAVEKCCPNVSKLIKELPSLETKSQQEIQKTIEDLLPCIQDNAVCINTVISEGGFSEEIARYIKSNAEKIFLGLVARWFYEKLVLNSSNPCSGKKSQNSCDKVTFQFKRGNTVLLTLEVTKKKNKEYEVSINYPEPHRKHEALFYLTYPKAPWMEKDCISFIGTYLIFTQIHSVNPATITSRNRIKGWKFGTAKRDCLKKLSITVNSSGNLTVTYKGSEVIIRR